MALLDRLERTRVTIDAVDQPLGQVVAELATAAGVPIRVDWDGLDSLGVDSDDRVTLLVRDATADAALTALTLSVGLGGDHPLHDVGGGQVVITTLAGAASLRCTDVYDLRPILVDDAAENALRAQVEAQARQAAEARQREELDDGPAAAPANPPDPTLPRDPQPPAEEGAGSPASAPPSRAARMAGLILDHVDPEGWLTAGGLRGRIDDHGDSLIVTATPRVHRQVRRVLGSLAALHPGALHVDVAVVTVDRSVLDLLLRRHEPASPALVRSLLVADGAAILWRNAGSVALGQTLTCTTKDGVNSVSLNATPGSITRDGRVSLKLQCSVSRPSGERSVSTTTSVPLRDGAVMADLGDLDGRALVVVALFAGS